MLHTPHNMSNLPMRKLIKCHQHQQQLKLHQIRQFRIKMHQNAFGGRAFAWTRLKSFSAPQTSRRNKGRGQERRKGKGDIEGKERKGKRRGEGKEEMERGNINGICLHHPRRGRQSAFHTASAFSTSPKH